MRLKVFEMICIGLCTNTAFLCKGFEHPLIFFRGSENYLLRDAEGHIFIKTSELKDRVQNPAESRLPGGLARD